MPSVSLVKVLSHFFMHPGKWDEVRTWMHEDDHGSLPPISREEWLSNLNIHKPLEDIMDGWFWLQALKEFGTRIGRQSTM